MEWGRTDIASYRMPTQPLAAQAHGHGTILFSCYSTPTYLNMHFDSILKVLTSRGLHLSWPEASTALAIQDSTLSCRSGAVRVARELRQAVSYRHGNHAGLQLRTTRTADYVGA